MLHGRQVLPVASGSYTLYYTFSVDDLPTTILTLMHACNVGAKMTRGVRLENW